MLEMIGSALEETERLAKIVDHLLTISRLDAGESRTSKIRLDLGQLAISTADQMRLLAEEKSISLVYEVAEGWAPLCGFLGLPVPDGPLPKVNSRDDFAARFAKSTGA